MREGKEMVCGGDSSENNISAKAQISAELRYFEYLDFVIYTPSINCDIL
jgi:hypothetical protein